MYSWTVPLPASVPRAAPQVGAARAGRAQAVEKWNSRNRRDWPHEHDTLDNQLTTLANGELELAVAVPGAAGTYCGTRFSWAGVITDINWRGYHLFGPWQPGPVPLDLHDNVSGTAGEFGMGMAGMPPPLGFDAAAPGEGFVKIGVGVLRRPDAQPYQFDGAYELVEAPAWQVEGGADRMEMRQRLEFGGFGYDYTHTIELIPGASAFVTRHRLTNTGGKPIRQTHYSHNLLILDWQPVGPDCEIIFPFTPGPALGDDSDAVLQGNRLGFRRPLQKAVFAMLTGFAGGVADNQVTVRNRRTGLAVRVTGDRPIVRYHFFATPGAVCPELFVEINAAPGEMIGWEHRYELSCGAA